LTFCRLTAPLIGATVIAMAQCEALAQSAPPAPPVQAGQTNDPAFPPVSNPPTPNVGPAPINPLMSKTPPAVAECMKEFAPLRDEAERRGKLIRDASDRHAGPVEACKLINSYKLAEIQMIKFVEAHAMACAIPASIADQLKNGHRNTEALQTKVCNVAQQMQKRGPAGPVGDFPPY
jgi:hypothetical protein